MLNKQTVVKTIEIANDGQIMLRIDAQVVEDGVVLASVHHPLPLPPGASVDDEIERKNINLAAEGHGAVGADDIKWVKSLVKVTHTAPVVAAYQAARALSQQGPAQGA